MADYFFRDDIEADKQREAEAAANGAAPTLAAPAVPAAPAAPTAPAQDKTFQNLGKAAASAAPDPNAKPDYFADFRSAMDAQDPFKQQAQTTISDSLKNPTAAFDAAASVQQDKLGRETAAEQERRRQQAVLQFGGNATGQVSRAMDTFGNEALMKQAELGRDLAAGRAAASEAGRGNAINQSLALLGERRQGAAAAADIGLQQEGQRDQTSLGREGLASQEKIAFAQLSQEDKSLAQNAMQFKDKLAWDKEALKLGLDDNAAARIWQAAEGEKSRLSQEKIAFAQIGSQEKLQSSQQAYEAAQNDLNRSLEKLLSNDRIQAQFQMADLDHAFQEKMQSAGFVQEKDIETMRQQLQVSLQERGIAADVAKQISDQKFNEMMAGRDQAFQQQMTEINQKFITGERIDTQTWESAMKAGDMAHDEAMAKLGSVLRLNEAGAAQNFQVSFQEMQNSFSEKMADKGYSHEDAMREATQEFQEKMEKAGYTHEEAMQASQLAAQAQENGLNRASQEMMASAQLAQNDSQFMQELQQKYSFGQQDLDLRQTELESHMKLMGLQGEQLTQAMGDAKVDTAMKMAALGMEIGNGSPESMAPFVEALGSAMSGYLKGQGVNLSTADFTKAMSSPSTPGAPGSTPTTKQTVEDFSNFVTKTGGFASLEDQQKFTTSMIGYKTLGANLPVDKVGGVPDTKENASLILEASERLKSLGITGSVLSTNFDRKRVGDFSSHDVYSASQPGMDYAIYARMIKSGLSDAEAKVALGKLLTPARAQAALALETGSVVSGVMAGAAAGAQAGGV